MRRLLLLTAVLALAPGCFWFTTKDEGNQMSKRIGDLDARVAKTEQSLDTRVKTLDESIDKATKLLARNSADLGTQVDKFSQDLGTMNGKLDLMQRTVDALRAQNEQLLAAKTDAEAKLAAALARLDTIERFVGIAKGGTVPSTQPTAVDKNALFDQAYQKLQSGQFGEARRMFLLYVQNFPQDDRADNALWYVGEAYYKEKDYEHAIATFQRVIDTYPSGDVADDAYNEAAAAALDEQECRAAAAYWGELMRKFPKSPFVTTAKTKLAYLKKNERNAKVCKPG